MFDRLWFGLCLWRLVGECEMCFYMFVFSKCPFTEAQTAAALVSVVNLV